MKAYIEQDTFIAGKPIFRGDTIEVTGKDDKLLKELQACGKVSDIDPFKEISKAPQAKPAQSAELAKKDAEIEKLKKQLEDAKK